MTSAARDLLLGLLLAVPASALAAAGDPDPTFGTNGAVTAAPGSKGQARGADIVLQPDGRIVVAGRVGKTTNAQAEAGAARLSPDGVLDPTFDDDGFVQTAVANRDAFSGALAGVLLPDGDLLVTGRYGVLRWEADGDVDTTWGDGGFLLALDSARDLLRLPDGRILVLGLDGDPAVARLLPDGSLDATFGAGGILRPPGLTASSLRVGALQPDGQLVAMGAGEQHPPSELVRLDAAGDGAFDAGFGTGGVVALTDAVPDFVARHIVLQPDGKILVAGGSAVAVPDSRAFLLRYADDGTLDPGFGADGVAVVDMQPGPEDTEILRLVLQPDGKILALGQSNADDGSFFVLRLDAAGAPDPTFGAAGFRSYDVEDFGLPNVGVVTQLHPQDAILLPDGRLLGAGYYLADGCGTFCARLFVFRLQGECGDGAPDPGEVCDDGNLLPNDCCTSACGYEAAGTACDADAELCTTDVCDGAGACTALGAVPQAGCATTLLPGKSTLTVRDLASDAADQVSWSWIGAATTAAELASPGTTTDYAFCVYDETTGGLLLGLHAPAGGTCDGKACWQAVGSNPPGSRGWRYRDRERTPDGLEAFVAKPGAAGKAKHTVKGKGPLLVLPGENAAAPLPLATPIQVRAQLKHRFGRCWEASYSSAVRNDATTLQLRSD